MASPSRISRPASSTASNALSIPGPDPVSRSKSTPIRHPTVPSAPAPPLPVNRPPRTSSISTTTSSTPAGSSVSSVPIAPRLPPLGTPQVTMSPPPLQFQAQQPRISSAPVIPQATGITSQAVLQDMMSIQSPINSSVNHNPHLLGMSSPSPILPNSQGSMQFTSTPLGVGPLGLNTNPTGVFPPQPQQTMITGVQSSPFGLGAGLSLAQTSTPPMHTPSPGTFQSPLPMNQTPPSFGMPQQQQQQQQFGSLSPNTGPGAGGLFPNQNLSSMPATGSPFSQMQTTTTTLEQMSLSMSPQPQRQTSNPFLMQQSSVSPGPTPLTNMYTGQPFQPYQQQQQPQQMNQFYPTPNFNNTQQPFVGNQNNPFSNQWMGQQQPAGGYGPGGGWGA